VRLSITALGLLVFACADSGGSDTGLTAASLPTLSAGEPGSSSGSASSGGSGDSGDSGDASGGGPVTSSGAQGTGEPTTGATDTGSEGGSTGVPAEGKTCSYESTSHGGAPKELMVPKGSPAQLEFTVPGLPDPGVVSAATLRFVSYDSDHPGEEGVIVVNGGAPIDLPAEPAWTNLDHATAVVVTGLTVAGDNKISFGAGSSDEGTFYRISEVALELEAAVAECPAPPVGPPVAVQLDFNDAIYTKRHNWVLRCDFGEGYAFTAKGDQARSTAASSTTPTARARAPRPSCSRTSRLRPTRSRSPRATAPTATRRGRCSWSTARPGASTRRVGDDITVDTWGTKQLAGTIEVVLDSDMEPESDSVTWVRLEPQ
jgi:hypothetical protein